MSKPTKTFRIYAQVVFAILVIMMGVTYCIRCIFAANWFCAACFAIMAYGSGYLLMYRSAVEELRRHRAGEEQQ